MKRGFLSGAGPGLKSGDRKWWGLAQLSRSLGILHLRLQTVSGSSQYHYVFLTILPGR